VATLRSQEVELRPLLAKLRTDDFFQSRTLTILTDSEVLFNDAGGKDNTNKGKGKTNIELMLAYLTKPDANAVLVLCGEKRPPKKLMDLIDQTGVIVEVPIIYENQVDAWVRQRARDKGITIDPRGTRELIERVGTDLFRLVAEMEKLRVFVGDKAPITADHVRELATPSREYIIFGITEAIFNRDAKRALTIIEQQMENGEGIMGVLAWIAKSIRNLWKITRDHRLNAPALGMKDYPFKQLKKFQNRFREEDFKKIQKLLLATDRAVKTTGLDARVAVERMVLAIAKM
jgi:DNA polymerase-3 subunit delta